MVIINRILIVKLMITYVIAENFDNDNNNTSLSAILANIFTCI